MKRIAYYGTWGRPGHNFMAIRGEFTAEEIRGITNIDSDVYIDPTAAEGFHYYRFGDFLGYGIPFSIDDKRSGCITAVFVEHAATAEDILNALDAFPELKQRFRRRLPVAPKHIHVKIRDPDALRLVRLQNTGIPGLRERGKVRHAVKSAGMSVAVRNRSEERRVGKE